MLVGRCFGRDHVQVARHLDLDREDRLIAHEIRATLAGERDDDPLCAPVNGQDLAALDLLDELIGRRMLDLARPVEPRVDNRASNYQRPQLARDGLDFR